MTFSDRINLLKPSATMELNSKAIELQSKGKDVVKLTAGEPDFDTPFPIIEAAYEAMKSGRTKYTDNKGIKELREKISKFINEKYLTDYTSNNIIISNGGKQALFNSLYAIINPHDEVIIFDPSWVSYDAQIRMLGGNPVHVKTYEKDGFLPKKENILNVISNKTKAIVINSPNNPTGIVYPKNILNLISEIAKENNLVVISDEVYDSLVYDKPFTSMATFKNIKDRLVIINSFSKAWSMTGWRIGYAIAPIEYINQMAKIQSHSTSNVNTPSQYAALKALEIDNSNMKIEFMKRRDYLYEEFKKIGFRFVKPSGAFYYFINIEDFGLTDIEFCEKLLDYGLAVVPGSAFYLEGYIRLSFAASLQELNKAVDILKRFILDLEKKR